MAEEVKLFIAPIEGFPDNYRVEVSGSGFSPNQNVNWQLKGEDLIFDDNIIAPRGGGLVGQDGSFYFSDNAIGGNLDEDWGEDEIYADVYYTDFGGSHYKSNTITGDF
jgi:hypothetical protein